MCSNEHCRGVECVAVVIVDWTSRWEVSRDIQFSRTRTPSVLLFSSFRFSLLIGLKIIIKVLAVFKDSSSFALAVIFPPELKETKQCENRDTRN